MALVKGNNAVLEIQYSGEYLPYACVQEVTLSESTTLLTTITEDSGEFETFTGGLSSWKVGLSGVFHLPVEGKITAFLLFNTQVRKNGLLIRITYTDKGGQIQTLTGRVLFPSKTITAAAGQLAKDTLEMQGSGPYLLAGAVTGGEEPGGGGEPGGTNEPILDLNGNNIQDFNGNNILDF